MKNPHLTFNAVIYTRREIARRAGFEISGFSEDPFKKAGMQLVYGLPDDGDHSTPSIYISPCAPQAWEELLDKQQDSLEWMELDRVLPAGHNLPFDYQIPVLLWGESAKSHDVFVEQTPEGSIIFHADILAAVFFMLSRWEESMTTDRDSHGRFPATSSVAYRQSFLDIPVVDAYALILRAWLQVIYPQWKPQINTFNIMLSHDIDQIGVYRPIFPFGIRRLIKDTVCHTDKMFDMFKETINGNWVDPFTDGVRQLAQASEDSGLHSEFYLMAANTPNKFDEGYSINSPLARQIIATIQNFGYEIGFHPSYFTYDHTELFQIEKARLESAVGVSLRGGRQHYLRADFPKTWRIWEQAGFEYDHTMTYADREGFRAGTCHPFQPFDHQEDRSLNLTEIPLIIMDGTLKQYRNMTIEEARQRILKLAKRCRAVEGIFSLLWHNKSISGEWQFWGEMYLALLPELKSLMQ